MASKNVTVIGLQWGDEGKGKIVDALSARSKYVARYCGGANAGHTVNIGDDTFALHLIPCGIFRKDVCNIIGNGVAFDPATAIEEIDALINANIPVGPEKLKISKSAQVVMPYHKKLDMLSEQNLGDTKIGTTARGIGPCYSDKAARSTAIRAGDLTNPELLREKIIRIVGIKNQLIAALYKAEPFDAEAMAKEYIAYGKRLMPMICNTGALLRKAIADGECCLFEGGQGSLLDVDHGTYPFVTSSNVSACGIASGTGVPPSQVGLVIGLIKAYTTRVGEGPFPTEQDNEMGNYLREKGNEYGTTTGRPRRCGWFDAFAVKYTSDLSGVNEYALSLLDVLTGLDEIKMCTGYEIDGKPLEYFDPEDMADAKCIYETLPGWSEDITQCKDYGDLPEAARAYVDRVEEITNTPVGFISVGPERTQTIIHHTSMPEIRCG